MMTALYLIRGVPGSGKTTLGNRLKEAGLVDYVCSTDDYMVGPDSKYRFDAARLRECHERCRISTRNRLSKGWSVAVCNTFTRRWEMQSYIDMADDLNCTLYFIRCEGDYVNIHGVPEEKVAEMRARFADWPGRC